MEKNIIIAPKTKIGDLLETYPHLEDVLISLSPSFAKLKNPILRITVAKVATLQQAAVIGGMRVDDLVNRLRKEVGQQGYSGDADEASSVLSNPPDWARAENIAESFDAVPLINAGSSPMAAIVSKARKLEPGKVLSFTTPFIPAPLLDTLKEQQFTVCTVQRGEQDFINFVIKG
jgi:hypothetical protein